LVTRTSSKWIPKKMILYHKFANWFCRIVIFYICNRVNLYQFYYVHGLKVFYFIWDI
jgi:hypothetical protein